MIRGKAGYLSQITALHLDRLRSFGKARHGKVQTRDVLVQARGADRRQGR